MSILRIETTQNVFLEYNLASIGERILAFLIDFSVMMLYTWIFTEIWQAFYSYTPSTRALIIFFGFILPISSYSLAQEVFFKGQTIGKKILHIKVVTLQGKQPTLNQYIVRWLFKLVDVWATLGAIGLAIASSNRFYQRLGDLAAGTCLIKLKSPAQLSKQIPIPEFHYFYEPKYPQVYMLSDLDINYLKEAILAYEKSKEESLLVPFVKRLQEIFRIEEIPNSSYQFLKQVIDDYTYMYSKEN